MPLPSSFRCLLLALLLTGCASHQPVTAPALVQGGTVAGLRTVGEGAELVVRTVASLTDNKTFFDDDLLQYDLLPVQVLVENDDYPGTLVFEPGNLRLVDPGGNGVPALPVEQVVEKAKKSFWRAAGWGAAFGIFGIIPSAINVSNTNDKLQADYQAKTLKNAVLPRDGRVEGMAFFDFVKTTPSLDGYAIELSLRDAVSDAVVTLRQPLAGAVEVRKPPGG